MNRKFIIYTGSYNENNGGIIALHKLCDLLNRAGQNAYLWNWDKPVFHAKNPWNYIKKYIKYFRRTVFHPFQYMTDFITPIASYKDLKDSIIIYPELIHGNPLKAENVVRWFLHKPGYHSGQTLYGENELYFFYQSVFNDPKINPHDDHFLQTIFIRDDIYYQTNFAQRHGTCYILRKGKGRTIIHDLNDSILVDDLSHKEMAKIFNQVKMCISYDTYTMYSRFAALCGAISVIVPEEGISKEEWQHEEINRYGLAYGFDDISYAIQTHHLLLPTVKKQEEEANKTVITLIEKCNAHFH